MGLSRTERLVRERMTLYDQSVDSITPQKLINPKALTTVIRDFFARSQLSQFMDQINSPRGAHAQASSLRARAGWSQPRPRRLRGA